MATNAALDELRRRRRRPEPGLPDQEPVGGVGSPGTARMGAGQVGAAQVDPAEAATTRTDVDAALSTLTPDFRAAVVLRDLCGLSYEEIADTLGIPPGTVRSRIARARAALAPLLGGKGTSGGPAGVKLTEDE